MGYSISFTLTRELVREYITARTLEVLRRDCEENISFSSDLVALALINTAVIIAVNVANTSFYLVLMYRGSCVICCPDKELRA
jgi:multisubunit Na+/H+ antiporter MnhC subunit